MAIQIDGVTIQGATSVTTGVQQNVSGTSDNIGFFPYGWPAYSAIQPGWTCVQTGAVVSAVDGVNHVITTVGTPFASGTSYTFTGSIGTGMVFGAGGTSFTLSSSDFTNFSTGYGAEGDGTGFGIGGGGHTSTQALYYANLSASVGGNAAKSAEILAYWTANGLNTNGGTYMFDVSWGPGSSTNTARNVVLLRFDYSDPNSTGLNIGTVDTNNAGWDTPGQDPYNAIFAANGSFYFPATFTLIQPTIEDSNDWC